VVQCDLLADLRRAGPHVEARIVGQQGAGGITRGLPAPFHQHARTGAHHVCGRLLQDAPAGRGDLGHLGGQVHFGEEHQLARIRRVDGKAGQRTQVTQQEDQEAERAGNGQGALADLVSGLETPVSGELRIAGKAPAAWSPREALAARIGRIPEDRHRTGTIADFSLTENAVLESYDHAPASRRGWMDWRAARRDAEAIIAKYDVRCPGPDTRIRLLSGGNMQKLILGRVLEAAPRIIFANQPVRGLDIGAVTYVQKQLIAARDGGAAVLLISEDLDEILTLSDVIRVISDGRLSPEFGRGEKTPAELGQWMAGQGFDHAA